MDVKVKNVRGILKTDSEFEQLDLMPKTAKFDELNVLETFHPAGKDYGHMVIDEPKTPFVFEEDLPRDLDTAELIHKLRLAAQSETPAFGIEDDSDDSSLDEDYPESLDEKVRRMEFERRRKLHYKEFLSVPLARRLIEEEFGEFDTTEEPVLPESESECVVEQCPTYEISGDDTTRSVKSTVTTMSYLASTELIPPPDIDPGFEPGHHCYHKLMAELSGMVLPAPTNQASLAVPEPKSSMKSEK